eukprot:363290-Chlamydomonas_euryale.AAC.6
MYTRARTQAACHLPRRLSAREAWSVCMALSRAACRTAHATCCPQASLSNACENITVRPTSMLRILSKRSQIHVQANRTSDVQPVGGWGGRRRIEPRPLAVLLGGAVSSEPGVAGGRTLPRVCAIAPLLSRVRAPWHMRRTTRERASNQAQRRRYLDIGVCEGRSRAVGTLRRFLSWGQSRVHCRPSGPGQAAMGATG